MLLQDLSLGIVLGDQDFLFYNAVNFVLPAGAAAAYVLLVLSGHFTIESAVVSEGINTEKTGE